MTNPPRPTSVLQSKLRSYLQRQRDAGITHSELCLCRDHARGLMPMASPAGRINAPLIQPPTAYESGAVPLPECPPTQTVALNLCDSLSCWACQWEVMDE